MFLSVSTAAYSQNEDVDSVVCETPKTFKGTLMNKEFNVNIVLNLYDKNVLIPQQAIFGEVDGYLKSNTDSRCWIITSSEISEDGKSADLEIINDYGSEDLTASLKYDEKTQTYKLTQLDGSTIKLAKNGKWQKLPKELIFTVLTKR